MRTIATPYLAVDETVLRANVAAMAAHAERMKVSLRPHVKTHKCLEIARLQLEAGAVGVTVATVAEAEVFVEDGVDDVFVAYPLWLDDAKAGRLRALARRVRRLRIGVDSAAGVGQAARGLAGSGVEVLVEVDSGQHRSGARVDAAGEVASAAVDAGLDCVGVFTFPGHSYAPAGGREGAGRDEAAALAAAATSLRSAGVEPRIVSGGSSPSLAFTDVGVVNEVRPGVYVFGDAQQWELGACEPADIALTVHATVVSHAGGRLVLDAGSKVLGADRAAWATGFGRLADHPQARVVILSEHHAVADLGHEELPPLGSLVRVVPNHACNAVNLVDELVVSGGGTWRVAARGANT